MRRLLFFTPFILLVTLRAPAQQPALQRIAFGSCANQEKKQPIWDAVVATRPELFLFIGDNIYGDTKDMAVMKQKWDKLGAQPGYQKLVKTCPVFAVWDDHDFGRNDAGTEYPRKKETQQLFLEFFKEPKDSPRWTRPGLYDAKVYGPPDKSVQVIMTDTRYFRSPLKKGKSGPGEGPYVGDPNPELTMLGDDQWQWLERQLKVPAKVRLLVSSVQVVAEDHHWEKWMNMPLQRERLFKLLKDTKANGVIILSGDRHLAELSMMDAGIGYPLYDLTSSGLTEGSRRWEKLETNRHRVATMNRGNNFGQIVIDWSREDPLIALQIHDESGEVLIRQKLPLSTLDPGFLTRTKAPGKLVQLDDGTALTGEEIKKRVGNKVTIKMKVHSTGASKGAGLIFLNTHDYREDENFTVVLNAKAQESLKKAGIDNPRSHFEGKNIVVTGVLSQFRERPQIMVSEAGQIEMQK